MAGSAYWRKTYADMVKRGLKLSKEQLYSMNNNSIKDAIVLFGGGCTAEVVSKEGLLFTNHHCGYDNIASSSSVEHNYLRDGFWAKSKQEEIACPGLSVQFLVKIEDVTETVLAKLKDVKPNDIIAKLPGILNELSAKASEGTGYEVRVSSFFKGNQFLQFTYQRYKDVRLVGAPLKVLVNLVGILITGNGHVTPAIFQFSECTWLLMENQLTTKRIMFPTNQNIFYRYLLKE